MAWTALLAAGAKFRAAALSAFITEVRPIHVRLGSNFDLATASTTLQSVTGLVVALAANTTYIVDADLVSHLATGATEDIKYGATWPTGATVDIHASGPSTTLAASTAPDMKVVFQGSATSGTTTVDFGTTTSNTTSRLRFYVANGANAGNLQIQAAQNTSGANIVTVVGGSMLFAQQAE